MKEFIQALQHGMCAFAFEDEEGVHIGFIQNEAIAEALALLDEDGDSKFAQVAYHLKGGSVTKLKGDPQSFFMGAWASTWEVAAGAFLEDD